MTGNHLGFHRTTVIQLLYCFTSSLLPVAVNKVDDLKQHQEEQTTSSQPVAGNVNPQADRTSQMYRVFPKMPLHRLHRWDTPHCSPGGGCTPGWVTDDTWRMQAHLLFHMPVSSCLQLSGNAPVWTHLFSCSFHYKKSKTGPMLQCPPCPNVQGPSTPAIIGKDQQSFSSSKKLFFWVANSKYKPATPLRGQRLHSDNDSLNDNLLPLTPRDAYLLNIDYRSLIINLKNN